jgi:hypothetical protein
MAAQSAAGEELRRLTLQAEVRELHREVVEVVAEMNRGAATDRIRPDLDHDRRRSFRPRDRRRADPEEPVSFSLEAEPVVDLRV